MDDGRAHPPQLCHDSDLSVQVARRLRDVCNVPHSAGLSWLVGTLPARRVLAYHCRVSVTVHRIVARATEATEPSALHGLKVRAVINLVLTCSVAIARLSLARTMGSRADV